MMIDTLATKRPSQRLLFVYLGLACLAGQSIACAGSRSVAQWRQHELDGQLVHSEAPGPAEYANYLRVRLAEDLGEGAPQHARRLLLANLELRPEDAQLWARLGQLELRLGRKHAALAACRQALHLAPKHELAKAVIDSISATGTKPATRTSRAPVR